MNTRVKYLAIAIATSLMTSTSAFAAESEVAVEPASQDENVVQVKKEKDSLIEKITVTSLRRVQAAQDIGVPLAAFDGKQMKNLGIKNATDVTKFTPGVVYSETSAVGVPVYTIRGVGFDDYSTAASSTVGIYVDEVSLPYPVMTTGLTFDVQRVEILKGPQGDLYGRNSTGGAFNFITNKPTEDFEAGFTVDYGSYQSLQVDGYVSGALSDSVSARFSFTKLKENEGWQEHAITGEEMGAQDLGGARLLVDWVATDSLSVLFNLHTSQNNSQNSVPQAFLYNPIYPGYGTAPTEVAGSPNQGDKLIDLNDPTSVSWSVSDKNGTSPIAPEKDQKGLGGSITLDWEIQDFADFLSITAFENFERKDGNDWDGSDTRNTDVFNQSKIDSVSQEFRLTSNSGDDVSWITGVFLSQDEVQESFFSDVLEASNSDFGYGIFLQYVDTQYKVKTDSASIYGHVEWQFTEDLTLVTGLRYTSENREISEACTYDVMGALTPILGTDPGDCGTFSPEFINEPFTDELSTNNVSGKIGIDYKFNDDTLIYGFVSNGFKSGGYQGAHASSTLQWGPYDKETLTAYELGIKTALPEQRMRINASLFDYQYDDKQVADFYPDPLFGPLSAIINLDKSEIKGAELEWIWNPLDGLDVRLAGTWLDAKVKTGTSFDLDAGDYVDIAGKNLGNSPEFQGSALVAYEFDLSNDWAIRTQLDATYSDSYFGYLQNDPDKHVVESYTVVNANVALLSAEGDWDISLYVRNLTDESYYHSISFANDLYVRSTARPLTAGISVSYNFF